VVGGCDKGENTALMDGQWSVVELLLAWVRPGMGSGRGLVGLGGGVGRIAKGIVAAATVAVAVVVSIRVGADTEDDDNNGGIGVGDSRPDDGTEVEPRSMPSVVAEYVLFVAATAASMIDCVGDCGSVYDRRRPARSVSGATAFGSGYPRSGDPSVPVGVAAVDCVLVDDDDDTTSRSSDSDRCVCRCGCQCGSGMLGVDPWIVGDCCCGDDCGIGCGAVGDDGVVLGAPQWCRSGCHTGRSSPALVLSRTEGAATVVVVSAGSGGGSGCGGVSSTGAGGNRCRGYRNRCCCCF
jgi:hypothetical protein